jgi:hypothetical protein
MNPQGSRRSRICKSRDGYNCSAPEVGKSAFCWCFHLFKNVVYYSISMYKSNMQKCIAHMRAMANISIAALSGLSKVVGGLVVAICAQQKGRDPMATFDLWAIFRNLAEGAVKAKPARHVVTSADDVDFSGNTISIGPASSVMNTHISDIEDVVLVPDNDFTNYNAIFRYRRRGGGLEERYGGTFPSGSAALSKLKSNLKSHKLG